MAASPRRVEGQRSQIRFEKLHRFGSCLPLLAPADAPEPAFAEPQGQPVLMDRAAHVIWKAGAAKHRPEGFPAVAVVGLEAGQTLREACAAAGVDPDADRAVIGLPLYAMLPGVSLKLRPLLPVR